ncbi:LysR substrate-binding domain-containing protein [Rhodopila sp.]|uniref:LysR substrate-binding domain-containing protein n=1 Tax=Rhodopila sp. TaxID=2480087 RepID=UPI002D8103AF|nr:LysR substrate-binding domain-containing protein [Rhodopila sp.]
MAHSAMLDPDLLQAFVLIADGATFTQAANRMGRTQSAISMQIKRLEEILGHPVLKRAKGGAVEVTEHGRFLLSRARTILALNEEVLSACHAPEITGTVRLGTPDDYALSYLPPILKRFAETHPAVQVDVVCSSSPELVEQLKTGALDLTLCSDGNQPRAWPITPLWRGPLSWITSTRHGQHRQNPLPLAMAHQECGWRSAAQTALEKAGIRHRIAYLSGTQAGTLAPVAAGLAVTVCALTVLPEGLRVVRPDEGLPPLPDFGIVMLKGRSPTQPLTDALADHIEARFSRDIAPPVAA